MGGSGNPICFRYQFYLHVVRMHPRVDKVACLSLELRCIREHSWYQVSSAKVFIHFIQEK